MCLTDCLLVLTKLIVCCCVWLFAVLFGACCLLLSVLRYVCLVCLCLFSSSVFVLLGQHSDIVIHELPFVVVASNPNKS